MVEITPEQNHIIRSTIDYLTKEKSPVILRYEGYVNTHQYPTSEEARLEELVNMFGDELPRHWDKFHEQFTTDEIGLAFTSLRKMMVIANHGAVLIGMRISGSFEDNFMVQGYELDLAKEVLKKAVAPATYAGSFESALAPIDFYGLGRNEIEIVLNKNVIDASVRLTQLACQFALQHGLVVSTE